jgi:hypothetical protein
VPLDPTNQQVSASKLNLTSVPTLFMMALSTTLVTGAGPGTRASRARRHQQVHCQAAAGPPKTLADAQGPPPPPTSTNGTGGNGESGGAQSCAGCARSAQALPLAARDPCLHPDGCLAECAFCCAHVRPQVRTFNSVHLHSHGTLTSKSNAPLPTRWRVVVLPVPQISLAIGQPVDSTCCRRLCLMLYR